MAGGVAVGVGVTEAVLVGAAEPVAVAEAEAAGVTLGVGEISALEVVEVGAADNSATVPVGEGAKPAGVGVVGKVTLAAVALLGRAVPPSAAAVAAVVAEMAAVSAASVTVEPAATRVYVGGGEASGRLRKRSPKPIKAAKMTKTANPARTLTSVDKDCCEEGGFGITHWAGETNRQPAFDDPDLTSTPFGNNITPISRRHQTDSAN